MIRNKNLCTRAESTQVLRFLSSSFNSFIMTNDKHDHVNWAHFHIH